MPTEYAQELQRELAAATRDGSLSAQELATYLFSDAAREGHSFDLQVLAGTIVNYHTQDRGVLSGTQIRDVSQETARRIADTLVENGVITSYSDTFIHNLVPAIVARGTGRAQ